jgi:hypothetical protein
MRLALLLLVMVVAGSAHAETYKWVDDKGRVNYSNTPPPSAGKAKQIRAVEERVSVYQTDPEYERYLRQRAAQIDAAREAEWQERRRYLVAAQAAYPPADYNQASYYPDYYGYAYGYIVGGGQRHRVMHHVAHHVPHAAPRSGGSRGFGGGRGGGHR